MNTNLMATLHLIKAWLSDTVHGDREAGNITLEQVLWAGAIVILVGVVVAALTAFIQSKLGALV
jgi:hypothetical protein